MQTINSTGYHEDKYKQHDSRRCKKTEFFPQTSKNCLLHKGGWDFARTNKLTVARIRYTRGRIERKDPRLEDRDKCHLHTLFFKVRPRVKILAPREGRDFPNECKHFTETLTFAILTK